MPALPCPGCTAGDYAGMRQYHSWWKDTTEKMQMLVDDPLAFVDEFGYLYDLDTTEYYDLETTEEWNDL